MKYVLGLTIALVFNACKHVHTPIIVGIQPLGPVTSNEIDAVKRGLDSVYHAKVIVLKAVALPASAFTTVKVPRYRADTLIAWLKDMKPDTIDYIMGLTGFDISTTKTDENGHTLKPLSSYEDWGIFGLGYIDDCSSVVSTYRYKAGVSEQLFTARLAKISVHELGHNLGLKHCPDKKCVMTDAVEKISTIDHAAMRLCPGCLKKIKWLLTRR